MELIENTTERDIVKLWPWVNQVRVAGYGRVAMWRADNMGCRPR